MDRQASCALHVFTFKEGLFSRLGHDLRLSFSKLEIRVERGRVRARVDLTSLAVDGAVQDGAVEAHFLDASDRARILEHAQHDVLDVRHHPEAVFEAEARELSAGVFSLPGDLTLHGVTAPLTLQAKVEGRMLAAQGELVPSVWSIKPFRALGGTLRVQDRVRFALSVALPSDVSAEHLRTATFTLSGE